MKKKILVVIMILLMALPAVVMATDYTLIWNPNTEEDLAGYKVYWGPEPGNYTNVTDVGLVTEYPITLADGQVWHMAVTAYDKSGLESDYSDEINTEKSASPTGLRFKPVARIVIEIPE